MSPSVMCLYHPKERGGEGGRLRVQKWNERVGIYEGPRDQGEHGDDDDNA